MEIGSFETSAFNRRQLEKYESIAWSPLAVIKNIILAAVTVLLFALFGSILTSPIPRALFGGNVITPNRFLILLTLLLIVITPVLRRRNSPLPVQQRPASVSGVPSVSLNGDPRVSAGSFSRPVDFAYVSPVQGFGAGYGSSPVPTRFDGGITPRRLPSAQHAPAPFVDDIHSVQKHEYMDLMPGWARKFEELIVMPHIVLPLVQSLKESDHILGDVFGKYGFRLSSSLGPPSANGVVYLSDRFLPNPVCNYPEAVALWNRRLGMEQLLNVPEFPSRYRDYVVSRIATWTSGIRFAYRPDVRADASGPSDSHILSHLIFASFDHLMGSGISFRERFVTLTSSSTSASSSLMDDEFQLFFNSKGQKGHQGRVAWLEQSGASTTGPLHFNVGTNQKVYGVPAGGGNLIEALCLLFHLLKKLSPTSAWMQIPHEVRIVLDSIVNQGAGLVTGLSVSRPALDSFKGF